MQDNGSPSSSVHKLIDSSLECIFSPVRGKAKRFVSFHDERVNERVNWLFGDKRKQARAKPSKTNWKNYDDGIPFSTLDLLLAPTFYERDMKYLPAVIAAPMMSSLHRWPYDNVQRNEKEESHNLSVEQMVAG